MIEHGKIYETIQSWNKEKLRYENTPFHNCLFLAYDNDGKPQNAFLRGTISNTNRPFKRDVEGSNKSYAFTLSGYPSSDRVFCYEGALDAISHACICKISGEDWRDGHRLSLGGISFLGLDRFLTDNPQITFIIACLDNDATGTRISEKHVDKYAAIGYAVERESSFYKDFNNDLTDLCQNRQDEEMEL